MNVNPSCSRMQEEVRVMESLPEVKKFMEEKRNLFNQLSLFSGTPMVSLMDVSLLYDSFLVEVSIFFYVQETKI